MKKMLITLLVLAMVAPVLADVAVTATDEGSGHLKIKIAPTAGAVVRGVALKLTNANGAIIDATTDVTATEFNTFIDYAFSNAGYVIGTGHAIANPAAAGVATLPAGDFSLCAGYLDQDADTTLGEGLIVDSFFDVFYTLSGDATINIALDTLRGGIVGDTLGAVTVQASQLLVGTLPETVSAPTVPTGPANGFKNVSYSFTTGGSASSYTDPVEYQFAWGDGSFSAWGAATQSKTYTTGGTFNVTAQARCVTHPAVVSAVSGVKTIQIVNCKGDFNASNNVSSADITLLVNYWNANKNAITKVAPVGLAGYVVGMDLNVSGTITSADITLVVNHWNATKNAITKIAPCMP